MGCGYNAIFTQITKRILHWNLHKKDRPVHTPLAGEL